MPMIDLINNDGSIKNQFQKEVSTGSDYSSSYTPDQISKIQAISNMNDLRTGSTLGSTFANLKAKENDYNQKLIQIRNKGVEALMDIPASKRAKAYPKLLEILKGQGADIGMPATYDAEFLSLLKNKKDDKFYELLLKHQYKMAEIAAKGQGEDELSKVMKREQAKDIVEAQKNVAETASTYEKFLSNKEKINSLIDRAKPGFGYSIGTLARRVTGQGKEVLDARAELDSSLKDYVVDGLKAFRGSISDKEREFLEKKSGTLDMTPGELKAMVEKAEKGFEDSLNSSSKVLGSLKTNAGLSDTTKAYSPVNKEVTSKKYSEDVLVF